MYWEFTNIQCRFFNSGSYRYYKNRGLTNFDPFYSSDYGFSRRADYLFPSKDLTKLKNFKASTIKSDSKLFFDETSKFPRFKLGLTSIKRCIKEAKANVIVVSGEQHYCTTTSEYVVLTQSEYEVVYLISSEDFTALFNNKLDLLKSCLPNIFTTELKILYRGTLNTYEKDSLYVAKYLTGEYTLPFITDNELDKFCNSMCPDPNYDEFINIIDMLNSDDAAVVQLGAKMLTGYNVDKYRLTFRLILMSRKKWYDWCRNLTAIKQLCNTLCIERWQVYDCFSNASGIVQEPKASYTVEDIAMAKKIAKTLITEDLQRYANMYYFTKNADWVPNERRVNLE